MFNSTVLDVIVGLIFTFMTVSLIASAMTEGIASILKTRSNTLFSEVKALLNNATTTAPGKPADITWQLFNHALINPRSDGSASSSTKPKVLPAYIDPKKFADALIEIAELSKTSKDEIIVSVNKISDPQLKKLLTGICNRAAGNVDKMRDELASWFDNAMDRVSGAYKRWSQLISFLLAFLMCAVLNINSIDIAKSLWAQPTVTKSISFAANLSDPGAMQAAISNLEKIAPVGWPGTRFQDTFAMPNIVFAFIGWAITAIATLFGAPFWFDALQSFVRLKGAGPSPDEKRTNAAAAA